MHYNLDITFIDLCAGIGGGRLGLEQQNYSCVDFAEIDKKALQTYTLLFNETSNGLGDLTTLNINLLPTPDLLIAGFPCQSYSIAGKRQGLQDARGQIIFEITKILQRKNIPYFILENVKGLLNLNKGKDFEYIIYLLKRAGYIVYHKILNSLHFGVPQSRERVYLIGIRKNLYSTNFEFPIGKYVNYNLANFLNLSGEKLTPNTNKYHTFIKYLNNKYNTGKFSLTDLLHINYTILDTRQSDLRLYQGFFSTLRKGRQGLLYVYNGNLYSLSKIEALLLQGFPLTIVEKIDTISNSTILEQAGNAMTVNVISDIAKSLKNLILLNKKESMSLAKRRSY